MGPVDTRTASAARPERSACVLVGAVVAYWSVGRLVRDPTGGCAPWISLIDDRTQDLRERLLAFMDEQVYPAEPVFREQEEAAEAAGRGWERLPVTADLKAEARRRGLWNLFLTGKAAKAVGSLDAEILPDPPLTNLQYAPLAEITGWSPALAPEALNCAAPDTGNMELLAEFGSPEQQERWLRPLLEGTIRSAFCMTEPAVASSDASNIATTITSDQATAT